MKIVVTLLVLDKVKRVTRIGDFILHILVTLILHVTDWRISNSNISKMYKTLMKETDLEDV